MAELACVLGLTHNPHVPRAIRPPDPHPGSAEVSARLELFREKLERARADVLISIGNDHLNHLFMDNMPAFLIGKMPSYPATHFNEVKEFGLPQAEVPGSPQISAELLERALERGVDFAFSNEIRLDHSIMVPLLWLRPDLDLPVVPVLANTLAPPLPPPRRYFDVGRVLREAISELDPQLRVAAIVSGHLSLEVGGPRQHEPRLVDPEFDARAVEWMRSGDVEGACDYSTYENLKRAGNMTHGFYLFIMALGLAKGLRHTHAEGLDVGFTGLPFFSWERI
jgi:protocatechuate 4,5-dioxygenase beta chain